MVQLMTVGILQLSREMYARNASSTLVQQGLAVSKEMLAGRHINGDSLENVTTSTAIMYSLAEHLDNQLGNFGLSLSQKNLGSFRSIIGNHRPTSYCSSIRSIPTS